MGGEGRVIGQTQGVRHFNLKILSFFLSFFFFFFAMGRTFLIKWPTVFNMIYAPDFSKTQIVWTVSDLIDNRQIAYIWWTSNRLLLTGTTVISLTCLHIRLSF